MLSSKQKGDIAESRAMEIITYSSEGNVSCYRPIADDDGIDLIVNKKGEIKPLFLQIKSRFNKNKNNRFIQNVGINTFTENIYFYILFILFNKDNLEIDCLWLIPSKDFKNKAYLKKEGETYKSFYRFSANPSFSIDKWSKYKIDSGVLGKELEKIIKVKY